MSENNKSSVDKNRFVLPNTFKKKNIYKKKKKKKNEENEKNIYFKREASKHLYLKTNK